MEHAQQLSALASVVAAVRASGRTVRLALHNTDRFGLIHLYFGDGRLVRVEGHASDPARNLRDLSTWRRGAIRIDNVAPSSTDAASPAALEAELNAALAELERQGVVHPVPPAVSFDSSSRPTPSPAGASSMLGLPSLDEMPNRSGGATSSGRMRASSGAPRSQPATNGVAASAGAHPEEMGVAAEPEQRLTDPQWQLLALAVRQVTEHAAQLVGARIADTMLRQSLGQTAPAHPFLAGLEVDQTGWLRTPGNGYTGRFTTLDAAEGVAALLTQIESRAGAVVGARRAQDMIATALIPFRVSLQQLGLTIRTS
jgi:hypothetical protein